MNSAGLLAACAGLTGLVSLRAVAAPCVSCEPVVNAGFVSEATGAAGDFQLRRAGVQADATWKIGIGTDGWFRVAQPQLLAAGVAASNLVGAQLRLFNHTQEVALAVSTEALFGPTDTFHFYGRRYDGPYATTNTYWLGFGGAGRRGPEVSGAAADGAPPVTTTCCRVRYGPKLLYRPYHQPLDASIDHWFAALVNSSGDTALALNTTNRVDGDATLQIRLYGLSTGNHQVRLQVNGSTIGTCVFSGPNLGVTNVSFAASLLRNGLSTLALRELVSGEVVYLLDATLEHPGLIRAASPAHSFCGQPGTNVYRVTGLATNTDVWLLDITHPAEPVHIIGGELAADGSGYALRFAYAGASIPRFLVVQPAGVRTAPAPYEAVFRHLDDTARQADYLVICPYELRHQAYRLAKHHFTNGLRVAIAPLPDIYNEFGYGVVDAAAIRQFIGYAYHHWAPPRPRFAVLIGEGTDDPLGLAGSVPALQVPVKFGPTPFVVAAQDMWYGLVDGDDALADLAIGRIAASSAAALSNAVNKIIAFGGAPVARNALLVADNDGVIDFAGTSDACIDSQLTTGGFTRIKVYLPYGSAQAAIQATINNGRRLVTYVGHGAMDRWSAQNIYNTGNAAALVNTVYPVVAVFSCNSASYVDRSAKCLAEVFIESPGGASSVYASTALSVETFADYIAAGFTKAFAVDQRKYLGDVALEAQLNLWAWNPNAAELLTYQIIGDPGLIVNPP
jgi:hypothetical protein